jgi:thymidylate kinase
MRRRGFTVALIGCDGAGKTTVARALERGTEMPVRYLYMGVGVDSSEHQLPTTRLANALKRRRGLHRGSSSPAAVPSAGVASRARKAVRSALRLTNRVAEEWYRQLLAVRHLWLGRIVVFDRHFTADYHAADVVAPRRTPSRRLHGLLLSRLYPQPDLVVFLDAPPQLLLARKGEGTPASLERRRADYRRFGSTLAEFTIVDAARPLEAVVADVAEIIREHGERL